MPPWARVPAAHWASCARRPLCRIHISNPRRNRRCHRRAESDNPLPASISNPRVADSSRSCAQLPHENVSRPEITDSTATPTSDSSRRHLEPSPALPHLLLLPNRAIASICVPPPPAPISRPPTPYDETATTISPIAALTSNPPRCAMRCDYCFSATTIRPSPHAPSPAFDKLLARGARQSSSATARSISTSRAPPESWRSSENVRRASRSLPPLRMLPTDSD